MRVIPEEFTAQVKRTGQVLITFKDRILSRIAQTHHSLKALYLRTNHIIGFYAETVQHVENHGRSGCLSVRATYDDTNLVFRLLVEIFRERVNLQSQFACFHQFGIIFPSMHTVNDCIDVGRYTLRMPSHLVRQ